MQEPTLATSLQVRLGLLAAIIATLALIAIKTFGYAPFFSLPGTRGLTAETMFLCCCYGLAFTLTARNQGVRLRPKFAARLAAIAGLIQVIHLLVERYVSFSRPWDGIITLAFMLATFFIWGCAAYIARGLGLSFFEACAAAVWCSMVTMTIAVFCGALLEWYVAPVSLESMRGWQEFQRTGWNDLFAFSIGNTLDSATSHLLMGPLIACLFGSAGYGVSRLLGSSRQLRSEPPQ